MSKSYVDGSIKAFLDKLATSSPEPGGGSVAALAGALGAGLVSMVANLTLGKEKYADVEDRVQLLLAEAEEVRAFLQDLVQSDTEAYAAVSAAMKLPRETEEQKAERDRRMQASLKEAANVPLAIGEQSLRVAQLSLTAAQIGNVNAVSDAGVAVLLADAAAESAALNVKINVGYISDQEYNQVSWARMQAIMDEVWQLRTKVLRLTYEKLG
ncbi:MAG TPA: cyclodeaminase/cyclohydrolase family protein [Thermoleophilia bacterium]|nr:cyclodeaminase/cyclohydrolase family protein [Thermoleophilia bacterium]